MLSFKASGEKYVCSTSKWKLAVGTPENGVLTLEAGSSLSVKSIPATLGEYSEQMALPGIRRPHASIDGLEASIDIPDTIPFGDEPSINRKIKVSSGLMTIVTDFELRHSFQMRGISAGGLAISGKIASVSILQIPKASAKPAFKELAFSDSKDGDPLFSSEMPPLVMLVTAEDGTVLEFTVGEDLWRWCAAGRLGGKSSFSIVRSPEGIDFKWDIFSLKSEEQEPIPGRNWRFSYMLAWKVESAKKRTAKKGGKDTFKSSFDMASFDWPESARIKTDRKKKSRGADVCVSSGAALNILKKWLRSNLADCSEGDIFALLNAEPHFCLDAAHMDRPKLKELPHWDACALVEFKRWANRQLAASGARLEIVLPDDSVFGILPSCSR